LYYIWRPSWFYAAILISKVKLNQIVDAYYKKQSKEKKENEKNAAHQEINYIM
jgi:hypothetical protein